MICDLQNQFFFEGMLKATIRKKKTYGAVRPFLKALDPNELHKFIYLLRNIPLHYPVLNIGQEIAKY